MAKTAPSNSAKRSDQVRMSEGLNEGARGPWRRLLKMSHRITTRIRMMGSMMAMRPMNSTRKSGMAITGYGSACMIGWLLRGVNENWQEGSEPSRPRGWRDLDEHRGGRRHDYGL